MARLHSPYSARRWSLCSSSPMYCHACRIDWFKGVQHACRDACSHGSIDVFTWRVTP